MGRRGGFVSIVKTEGFAELDAALQELPKATSRNVMRRAGKDALEPMRAKASALAVDAPQIGEGLKYSLKIDTKLNPRARAMYRREGPSEVYIHMGPAPSNAKAVVNEFGSYKMSAQPYMRPAWDSEKHPTLQRLLEALRNHLMKAAARAARKAARLG